MLQTLTEFKDGLRQGLQVHKAMNKVTDFAPIELSCRWKRQFESREQRLSFDEFMAKKNEMLWFFMTYKAGL